MLLLSAQPEQASSTCYRGNCGGCKLAFVKLVKGIDVLSLGPSVSVSVFHLRLCKQILHLQN